MTLFYYFHFASSSEGMISNEEVGSVWTDAWCCNVVSEIVLTRNLRLSQRCRRMSRSYGLLRRVCCRRFGKAYRSHLQKSAVCADGTDRLCRNFSEKFPTYTALRTRRVKTFIVLTFEWKIRGKQRINLIFPAFEKLKVTNQTTVSLEGNNYINNKSVQPLWRHKIN